MTPAVAAHVAMLVFSGLIAGSFALGSLAAPQIAPTALTALRFALAAAILGGAALATGRLHRRDFRAPWRYLVLGGAMGLYFVLMFEGLKTAPPVSAAAVFTLTPILSGAFAYLLLRQRMTRRMALALAIGAAGALWVIFRGDLGALIALDVGRGEAVYFVGCVAHAAYIPLVRLLNRGEASVTFSFGTLVASAGMVAVAGAGDIAATDWAALPGIVWITLAYVTVAATAVTFVLVQFASLRLPSAKVMAYTYLVPSWVLLWQAALGLGTPPAPVMAGLVLTVGALWLLLKDEESPA